MKRIKVVTGRWAEKGVQKKITAFFPASRRDAELKEWVCNLIGRRSTNIDVLIAEEMAQ